jgi:hypothetical protein
MFPFSDRLNSQSLGAAHPILQEIDMFPWLPTPNCQGLPRFPRAAKGLYAPSELPSLSRRFPPSLRADHLEDMETRAISLRNDPKKLAFPDGFVNSLGGSVMQYSLYNIK